ncbi:hypothetical protein WJX77_002891 [Trebouxia sp. C0004]
MAAKLEVKHQLLENGSYSDKTLWMSAAIGKIFCALHLVNYFFSWHMDWSKIRNTLQLSLACAVTELAYVQQVNSMATYVQPKFSNHLTLDALHCGTVRAVSGCAEARYCPVPDRCVEA